MKETPFHMQNRHSIKPQSAISAVQTSPAHSSQQTQDDLTRIFNTALVASQAETKRDFSAELHRLTQDASFKAILSAVRHLSRVQGISERQASEQVIQTFRSLDEIWNQYLYREGLDRMRNSHR